MATRAAQHHFPLVVHATHEAGLKLGGIGAVLDGLLTAGPYTQSVARSILAGPMFANDPAHMERLSHPRAGIEIHYSSLHGITGGVSESVRQALQIVEQTFAVGVLYGTRRFGSVQHEILLVDATAPNLVELDRFKFFVWQNYGIDSGRYNWSDEYNLYFAIAQPLLRGLKAIGADVDLAPNDKFIIAHEWLGMPLVFAAQLNEPQQWRTIFYAHETATARRIVEEHDGHDTRFYNVLAKGRDWQLNLDQIFGDQYDLFKHPILRQATRCDNIFSVGDLVTEELRFLGGDLAHARIDLVYNGIQHSASPNPADDQTARRASKARLQHYCENILGYRPDYVFTHVTRLVLSKALWRDIRIMEHLETRLAQENKRAVLFVLSTSVPAGRRPEWVEAWEAQYGWPVGHRADNGDLIDQEVPFFFHGIDPFNQRAQHSNIVLVNQFGWSQDRCGTRMPADMEFMDIRRGSDLEFGQSIYEPFGIAQVEPLPYGALSCVSSVCGCVGFVQRAAAQLDPNLHLVPKARLITPHYTLGGQPADPQVPAVSLPANVVVADYVQLPEGYWIDSPFDALGIDRSIRDWIEHHNSQAAADAIFARLPRTPEDEARLLETGQALAAQMSWDVVVREFFLPGLANARQ